MELGLNENRELRTPGGVIVPKTSGAGLKVDNDSPTFPWADLLGAVGYDVEAAANRPNFATYRGNLKQYQFAVGDRVYTEYHIPHDYVPGTTIYVHVHWSHTAANAASGGVTWAFEASYAKGHNQAPFATPVTLTVAQAASTVQYQHMIAETELSAVGGAGGLLVTGDIEPDGVIIMRTHLSANTISAATNPFCHFIDLHYQSTGVGTKQKSPDFYT